MALPTTREEFKLNCLRRLGHPVIEINVDDDQVDDRVDEALSKYWDYHFDGTNKTFFKYTLTQTDINNQWVPVPENVIGIVHLFPIGSSLSTNNLFNIRYQIALNDLYTLTSTSMVPYYMAMQHIQTLEQLLVGLQPFRYNRHRDRLHIDMNWGQVQVGYVIVAEAYEVVDPEVFTDVWKDNWLQRYATALIKRQWGSNLTKFSGMVLPGGVTFNGEKILDDAVAEQTKMEDELIVNYGAIMHDMMG
jgi:hypothetical protein